MSKGSHQRPREVPLEELKSNWERIFRTNRDEYIDSSTKSNTKGLKRICPIHGVDNQETTTPIED